MHYYSHHCAIYAMSTAHLSEREDLFYRRLRDQYMFRDGRLPVLLGDVAKLVRAKTEAARKAVGTVLSTFFSWSDEAGWRLPELDQQLSATGRGGAAVVQSSGAVVAATLSSYTQAPQAAPAVAPPFALEAGGPGGDAMRQQRSRLLRKHVFAELARRGQVLPGTTSAEVSKAAVNALPDRAAAWQGIWAAVNVEMAVYEAKRRAPVAAHVTATTSHVTSHVTGEVEGKEEKEEGLQRDVTCDAACGVAAHTVSEEEAGSVVAAPAAVAKPAGLDERKPALEARHALSAQQKPLAGMLAAVPVVAAVGKYTAVAEAMRAAGLATVPVGDTELRRLVDAGVAVEVFVEAAATAAQRVKPLAWALARVAGKQKDAACAAAGGGAAADPVLTTEQVSYVLPVGVTTERAGQALAGLQAAGRIKAGLTLGEAMGSMAVRAVLLAVLRRAA